jgi:hypothetical protein
MMTNIALYSMLFFYLCIAVTLLILDGAEL